MQFASGSLGLGPSMMVNDLAALEANLISKSEIWDEK